MTYIVAQTPSTKNPASNPTGEPPAYLQFIPIILLVVIFYVFMFRSKNGEKKKREGMLSELKKGDEVQTIGGVFGRVMETRDDRVLVKVDESTNTKMWFTRSAIHRVITEDAKAEAK